MSRLVRIYCGSCSKVAATIDRLDADTPLSEHSHLIAPAGTLAIVMSITQAWPPEGKPARRKLQVVQPLAAPSGTTILDCPKCNRTMDIDLSEARTAVKLRRDLRPRPHDPQAFR